MKNKFSAGVAQDIVDRSGPELAQDIVVRILGLMRRHEEKE